VTANLKESGGIPIAIGGKGEQANWHQQPLVIYIMPQLQIQIILLRSQGKQQYVRVLIQQIQPQYLPLFSLQQDIPK